MEEKTLKRLKRFIRDYPILARLLLSPFFVVNIDYDMDKPLFYLSGKGFFKKNPVTVRQLCSGMHVYGSSGSSKSSTTMKLAISGILKQPDIGGIFLCVKTEDAQAYIKLAVQYGRAQDLIIVDDSFRWKFNFLDYLSKHPTAGLSGNLTHLFMQTIEVANRSSHNTGDRFWIDLCRKLVQALIDLISLSNAPLSVQNMVELLHDVEQYKYLSAEEKEQFFQASFMGNVLAEAKINADSRGQSEWYRFEASTDFLMKEWLTMGDKQASSVLSVFTNISDMFMRDPLRTLLSSDSNFSLDQTFTDSKLIILALPIDLYQREGLVFQNLMKLIYQRICLLRDIKLHPTPVFICADEYSNFITGGEYGDDNFLSRCRSYRVINLYAAQAISQYYSILPGDKGKAMTHSILSNLSLKVFHNLSDTETAEYASKLFGDSYIWENTISDNSGLNYSSDKVSRSSSDGISRRREKRPRVLPTEFTTLRTGAKENNYKADVIILHSQRKFHNGTNLLRTTFDQREV